MPLKWPTKNAYDTRKYGTKKLRSVYAESISLTVSDLSSAPTVGKRNFRNIDKYVVDK